MLSTSQQGIYTQSLAVNRPHAAVRCSSFKVAEGRCLNLGVEGPSSLQQICTQQESELPCGAAGCAKQQAQLIPGCEVQAV